MLNSNNFISTFFIKKLSLLFCQGNAHYNKSYFKQYSRITNLVAVFLKNFKRLVYSVSNQKVNTNNVNFFSEQNKLLIY